MKVLIALFLFLPIFLYSEDEPETKKILNWKGEIHSVYKAKGTLRIRIHKGKQWKYSSEEDLRQQFMTQKTFFLFEKKTNKKVGEFNLQDLNFEYLPPSLNKERIYLVLSGDYTPLPGKNHKRITTNLYVASYKEIPSYLEPSSFYKDTQNHGKGIIRHKIDGKEMILIPAGTFLYGQGIDSENDAYNPFYNNPDESNLADLPSFYMDKYEVTNGEYLKFINSTNFPAPVHWKKGMYPAGKAHHPVNHLSYREVEAYAQWSGKRIPTELEWEKAARGPGFTKTLNRDETSTFKVDALRYPFGNTFDAGLCNSRESKLFETVSVYELSTAGKSPYGLMGMCGNVAEWTSSWYKPYKGHYLKHRAFGQQYRVIRGGSFTSSKREVSTFFRDYGGIPNLKEDRKAGFRLVVDYDSAY
ncbi:MAG: SUMF1/EgtB/PvdO family nonheme iron enzyme [Leptospiraceae bacterium]|nr:SUMF1/EgtB/PvdO family nonheme iron enzyme [Leptospiraceae bacterium]MCP5498937.1 SUMF1/EgtB/PvdO family nonheme iron enzyme [Leptospiraceae bacterium]